MKKTALAVFSALGLMFSAWGQVLTPAGPALPSSAPAPVMSLDGSVLLPGEPVMVPPIPVTAPTTTLVNTNPPTPPVNTTALASLLLNLRFVIDRTLPRLAAYNGTVASINSGTNIDDSVANGAVSVGASGVNRGVNASRNVSAAAGVNLSQNLSTPVGAVPSTGVSGTPTTPAALMTQETISGLEVLQSDLAQAQSILSALGIGPGLTPQLPSTSP